MCAGPALLPADVRDQLRPWTIGYIAFVALAAVPLILLGRRHLPKIRQEDAANTAARAAAFAAVRPARLTLPTRKPGDPDPGPIFHIISKTLAVQPGGVMYLGHVVASPDYLIVVVQEMRSTFASGAAAGGGAAGGLLGALAGAAVGALADNKSPLAPLVMPLPDTFLKHQDWPLERKPSGPAIILPRSAVQNLRATKMGGLRFTIANQTLGVPLSITSRTKTLATLRHLGWPL